jgi:hypothetical protein
VVLNSHLAFIAFTPKQAPLRLIITSQFSRQKKLALITLSRPHPFQPSPDLSRSLFAAGYSGTHGTIQYTTLGLAEGESGVGSTLRPPKT